MCLCSPLALGKVPPSYMKHMLHLPHDEPIYIAAMQRIPQESTIGRLHVSGTSSAWPQKTHRPPLFARLTNTLPNPLGCRPHPSPTPSATRSPHPTCAAGPWAEPETGPGPFLVLETIPLPRPISGHALQSRTSRTVCGGTHRSHPSLNFADGHLRAEDISASRKPGPPYPSRLPGLEHAAQ